MLLNDMADVLRAGGSTVEEVPGWIGRNHGALIQVSCIVIHHTATSASAAGDYPSLGIVRDGRPDLAGPLAQLGGGRSGKIYAISNGVAYHAGTVLQSWMNNDHSIGIEVESPGTGAVWPDAQVQGVARAVASLCKRFNVPAARVLGHKEVCSPPGRKIDPVGIPGDMPAFRALVQRYINGEFDRSPEDAPKEEEDNMVKFMRGDSTAKDPNGVPWGYRVFKVEFSGDFESTAVRTPITDEKDPGYQAHLQSGGQVYVIKQTDLDRIPMKSVSETPAS
jgi:hypothetical protein